MSDSSRDGVQSWTELMNARDHIRAVAEALCDAAGELVAGQRVHDQREMRAVLFDRSDRDDDYDAFKDVEEYVYSRFKRCVYHRYETIASTSHR